MRHRAEILQGIDSVRLSAISVMAVSDAPLDHRRNTVLLSHILVHVMHQAKVGNLRCEVG